MARSCYPQDKEDKMETRGPRRQEKADLCSPLCGCEAEKWSGKSVSLPTAGWQLREMPSASPPWSGVQTPPQCQQNPGRLPVLGKNRTVHVPPHSSSSPRRCRQCPALAGQLHGVLTSVWQGHLALISQATTSLKPQPTPAPARWCQSLTHTNLPSEKIKKVLNNTRGSPPRLHLSS